MPRRALLSRRRESGSSTHHRRLGFEALEDRRLLAIIADTFAQSFAQVSYTNGNENTIVTGDTAAHEKVFYRPNDELGYIDPATGNLLTLSVFSGTSTVLVYDATVKGNASSLVGKQYSNGQVIATNGGSTIYHRDGSIMRSGGVWTYDAGAPLENASGNWFWSNGNQLMTGTSLFHSNGAALRTGSSLFYATGAAFQNGTTLSYTTGQALKNSSGNYFYQSGSQLRTGNVIYHPIGSVMVEAGGIVHNPNGDLSFTPYTRTNTFSFSEARTEVSPFASTTTVSVQTDAASAYVTRFVINYFAIPPTPLDITVTAPAAGTLRFSWTSGGGSTNGYRIAAALGVSPPSDVAAGSSISNNYYEITGLPAGQEVSVRVWARDGAGLLSQSVYASGTAGQEEQSPQTGWLVASALQNTFVQAFDSVDKNVIYTVDRADNFFVVKYVNDELGYVNLANGDRVVTGSYVLPHTALVAPDVIDFRVIANLSEIPSGAKYPNGSLVRNGNTYYYESGAVLRNASGAWFYENGAVLQNATAPYWPGNIAIHSGTTSRFPNNATLKSGSTINYQTGNAFRGTTTYSYPNGLTLQNAAGSLTYQSGGQLFASDVFSYFNGSTMIDSTGTPHLSGGSAATAPFEHTEPLSTSTSYVSLDADRIARYAVAVSSTTSVHVLGGAIDYAARNGDFNDDDSVSALDYVLWRNTLGSTFQLGADGSANSTVDAADHTVWKAHFGQTLPALGASSYAAEVLNSPVKQSPTLGALAFVTGPADEVGQASPDASPIESRVLQPEQLENASRDSALLAWLDARGSNERSITDTDATVTLQPLDSQTTDDALSEISLLLW